MRLPVLRRAYSGVSTPVGAPGIPASRLVLTEISAGLGSKSQAKRLLQLFKEYSQRNVSEEYTHYFSKVDKEPNEILFYQNLSRNVRTPKRQMENILRGGHYSAITNQRRALHAPTSRGR
ncbi:hypothetical protein EVAR_23206_1 [Eumeta japonica]|uniref:Uncharacterized protein n=1 Tax=Eumeta variegata TaxID=151549 RepID=A0A4C1VFY2_EUMVA|nr:hypothetical protein EVAR_23206_1 [Eumeta japonica]